MKRGREEILRYVRKGDRCAEIGVWRGSFAQEILKKEPSELHLIDPWRHRWNYYGRIYGRTPQKKMNKIHDQVKIRFKDNNKVHIHRQFSAQAVKMFENNYFDWIYLDADHSYHQVRLDLYLWLPKTRYLCGDDYSRGWPGVVRAVRRFTRKNKLSLLIFGHQFVIKTKPLLL
jgi:hypothetical protein